MSTAENTSQLVDTITEVSLALFQERGFEAVTVSIIAEQANTTTEAVATLFPGKDDLLAECVWRDIKQAAEAFGQSRATQCTNDTIMVDFCRFICIDRIKAGKSGRFRGLYHPDMMIKTATRDGLRRLLYLLIEDGIQQGWFKPLHPELASDVVAAMLLTALDRFHEFTEPLPLFTETLSMIGDAINRRTQVSVDRHM